MGPLTGQGSPSRWFVHGGRLYVFASESCREKFSADPARFIDGPDPVPRPTAGEASEARRILDRAAGAFGPALTRLRTLEIVFEAS